LLQLVFCIFFFVCISFEDAVAFCFAVPSVTVKFSLYTPHRLLVESLQKWPALRIFDGMAAIWGNGGQGGQFPLEQWFYEMPPVTRWWTAATVATSVLIHCHILTPLQLFYSFRAVYVKSQVRHRGFI
jgi:hypothetical protein